MLSPISYEIYGNFQRNLWAGFGDVSISLRTTESNTCQIEENTLPCSPPNCTLYLQLLVVSFSICWLYVKHAYYFRKVHILTILIIYILVMYIEVRLQSSAWRIAVIHISKFFHFLPMTQDKYICRLLAIVTTLIYSHDLVNDTESTREDMYWNSDSNVHFLFL